MRSPPLVLALALSGCAGYIVDGERYRTANSALNAQNVALDEQLTQIAPLAYVGGSVLLVLPGDSEIASPPYADRKLNVLSPERSFLLHYWRQEINATARALRRAEVFDTAEVRRSDEPEVYAREYGYRFVLRDEGPRWFLEDTLTGVARELHGVGLKDLCQRSQAAASIMMASHKTPASRLVSPASVTPSEDKKGKYTLGFPGESLEARARVLARAREECSGPFRIEDEFLQDGILTVRFACLGQRVSSL
jgi:hypothetical protein